MAELKRRLEEQTQAQAALIGQLSLPATYTERVALVVGNTRYSERPLVNPAYHARAMRQRLQDIGFKVLYFEDVKVTEIGVVYEQVNTVIQLKPGAVRMAGRTPAALARLSQLSTDRTAKSLIHIAAKP